MNKAVLGIDLGTSSVKVMLKYKNGDVKKVRESYDEISPKGWSEAIRKAVLKLDISDVSAVGLSSQVGTYIIDDEKVISWNDGVGREELGKLKQRYESKDFLEEISMPHPDIISYPLPRLIYIKENYQKTASVCQPKDYICELLTGKRVSDKYSWRGLADLQKCKYSQRFLTELGIDNLNLPKLIDFSEEAGVTKDCDFLPEGIPVFVGLNDYYASLVGMGICNPGDMFDITGTSEHLGILEEKIRPETDMVSGPFIYENVHYGVTASSGASLSLGLSFSETVDIEKSLMKNAPVFLPYLNGERAPIWDNDAKGAFLGINKDCEKSDFAYAVLEGVVFSLYHIYEHMGKPAAKSLKISGGAAENRALNLLKAEMLDIPVITQEENDTSALGACMIAAKGIGWYKDLKEAEMDFCKVKEIIKPVGSFRNTLMKRYEIYKESYPVLKDLNYKFKNIRRNF